MKMNGRAVLYAFALLAAVTALASIAPRSEADARRRSPKPPADGAEKVVIKFKAVVGSRAFDCRESYEGIGSSNSKVKVTDFRFYVSDVRLVNASGKEMAVSLTSDGRWQSERVALIAFANGDGSCAPNERNVEIRGDAPRGRYVGLRFTVGVPLRENHADQSSAPSPLNLSKLYWSWNSGYKFISLEMSTTGNPNGYVLHLGSTDCKPSEGVNASTQCGFPNRPEIDLAKFDPKADAVTLDLKALYQGVNVDTDQANTAVGCMSSQRDADCAGVFKNMGLPFAGMKASAQQFIRVERRTADAARPAARTASEVRQAYPWDLPKGFPVPRVPADNPMTTAKVELGRFLFYDRRLSINQTTSCATCHLQERAFTDGKARAVGATGEVHPRGSMSLANVAYSPTLTWANPSVTLLERQPLVPLFGEHPVEMGMAGREKELMARIRAERRYESLFADAYPDEPDAYSLGNVAKALACFVRTLISGDSPYDRYKFRGERDAITDSARRGEELFFSERLECFDCHAGFNLSGPSDYAGKAFVEKTFHNNGLYNTDGKGSYPADNTGLFEFTSNPKDMGKFKVPTLRNVELTAPYMHDGSVATLRDAIEHYKTGGRTIAAGENAGAGSKSPHKSSLVRGFELTEAETEDLLAFLRSLTDSKFVNNPKFGNPWTTN